MRNPAVMGTIGTHFDGCSESIGTKALPTGVFFNGLMPFVAGMPWGKHIVQSKHCKHLIGVAMGCPHVFVDGDELSVTSMPMLTCGAPSLSPVLNVIIT